MIRCCLIDDQPAAMELVATFLKMTPGYEIVAMLSDSVTTFQKFDTGEIVADITFMDIDMPGLSGIELGKRIKDKTAIVYITAHRNFAPESYENDAVDYLVKPISYDKFLRALDKASTRLNSINQVNQGSFTFIPGNGKTEKIKVNKEEVIYVQGSSNYVWVFTEQGDYMTYLSMSQMEVKLPGNNFIRVHKSYLVNLNKVLKYNSSTIFLPPNKEIPIGDSYKNDFLAKVNLY